ncbi:MAG TPA: hypothetical protein VGJ20_15345 [Xanthobacteraceae bacterium]
MAEAFANPSNATAHGYGQGCRVIVKWAASLAAPSGCIINLQQL